LIVYSFFAHIITHIIIEVILEKEHQINSSFFNNLLIKVKKKEKNLNNFVVLTRKANNSQMN